MHQRKTRGFTLVEILVVVVILGILATVVAVNVGGKVDAASAKLTVAHLKRLRGEVQLFRLDQGRYPAALADLPDEDKPVLDGWSRSYDYRLPGETRPFDIVSFGADGRPGGQGHDADLSCHSAR